MSDGTVIRTKGEVIGVENNTGLYHVNGGPTLFGDGKPRFFA
jgi:hypothetical protein